MKVGALVVCAVIPIIEEKNICNFPDEIACVIPAGIAIGMNVLGVVDVQDCGHGNLLRNENKQKGFLPIPDKGDDHQDDKDYEL